MSRPVLLAGPALVRKSFFRPSHSPFYVSYP
jgi:hypothetical protein